MEINKRWMTLNELESKIEDLFPNLKEASEKAPVNPFKTEIRFTLVDKIKIGCFCFLVPVRVILLGITFLVAGFVSKLFLCGYKDDDPPQPISGFRIIGQRLIWMLGRATGFICGFHNVPVKGKLADATLAPIIVIGPHTSFVDGVNIGVLGNHFTTVSRLENIKTPIVGNSLRLIQPAIVSRIVKDSRQLAVKEIKRRACDDRWPPIIIFPEGTTTNHRCFITFKPGAFHPGLPVQPVILRYGNKLDCFSWTWQGYSFVPLLCFMLSHLTNKQSFEVLPVYNPSEEEKKDAFLFARNVRQYMAEAAQLPTTDHSYEDCRLMMEAEKLGLPLESTLVEFSKISPIVGMDCESMIEHLRKFATIDTDSNGLIDLEEFCDYLCLPPVEEVRTIFRIYDMNKNKGISFCEFLLGTIIISSRLDHKYLISNLFSALDIEENNIPCTLFTSFITSKLSVEKADAERLFRDMDKSGTGVLSKGDLEEFLMRKPEVRLLFMDMCVK